jgi:hypothetical protein
VTQGTAQVNAELAVPEQPDDVRPADGRHAGRLRQVGERHRLPLLPADSGEQLLAHAEKVPRRPPARGQVDKDAPDMRPPARDHRVPPAAGGRHFPGRRELQRVLFLDRLHRADVQQPHPTADHGQEVRDVPRMPARMLEVQPERKSSRNGCDSTSDALKKSSATSRLTSSD